MIFTIILKLFAWPDRVKLTLISIVTSFLVLALLCQFTHEAVPQIQPVDSITHGGRDNRTDHFFLGSKQLQAINYSVCQKRNAS